MPILLKKATVEEPPVPPSPPSLPPVVDLTWYPPVGDPLNLMHREAFGPGVLVLDEGLQGLWAAPREITRRGLSTGGSYARYSHAAGRPIVLPLHVHADNVDDFATLRRLVSRSFTCTSPPAGTPTAGVLRYTRRDGTWREIWCVYENGLGEPETGIIHDTPVVELLADDPWWYGPEQYVLEFEAGPARNFLNPYVSVSPDRTLGSSTVDIEGDVPALPLWTITGPATSVTVRYESNGPGWTFGSIDSGETITIDVLHHTVTDDTGTNRIGDIAWQTSSLFPLQPGENDLLLSITGGVDGTSKVVLRYRPRYESA